MEVGVAAAATTTRLERRPATVGITAGVFLLGVPSALSYSPVSLTFLGRPVLDIVDESVGTFALPISALLIVAVFVWVVDLGAVRADLGGLYPLVRYLILVVLIGITGAKVAGIARPAWRLLVGTARADGLAVSVAVALFGLLVIVGWVLRNRGRLPTRSGRNRR